MNGRRTARHLDRHFLTMLLGASATGVTIVGVALCLLAIPFATRAPAQPEAQLMLAASARSRADRRTTRSSLRGPLIVVVPLVALSPLITTVVSWRLLRQRLSRAQRVGLVVATAGSALVSVSVD